MFLTLEDPRAQVKGSVDPLGLQPIWTGFGRHLVTNLTTVTTSVRQFTVLMMGRWIAQDLIERGRVGEDDALPLFLRFEQIAGYARHTVHGVDDDIRGIERIMRNLSESRRVTIQDDASGMILSDQKTYGIWGLYSVSARISGLLDPDSLGVTPMADEFLDRSAKPVLQSVEKELTRLMLRGGDIDPRRNTTVRALADVMNPVLSDDESDFYGSTLRDASRVQEPELTTAARRQARFARMLRNHATLTEPVGRTELTVILERARDSDPDLAHPVDRVIRLESLLAIAHEVFRFAQSRSGQTLTSLATELSDRWGQRLPNLESNTLHDLHEEIVRHAGTENAAFAMQACDAFANGDYEGAIETLIAWNANVMHARRGAAWIQLEAGGRLDCRFRAPEQPLPTGDDLKTFWRNTYFIDSLKSVIHQVESQA